MLSVCRHPPHHWVLLPPACHPPCSLLCHILPGSALCVRPTTTEKAIQGLALLNSIHSTSSIGIVCSLVYPPPYSTDLNPLLLCNYLCLNLNRCEASVYILSRKNHHKMNSLMERIKFSNANNLSKGTCPSLLALQKRSLPTQRDGHDCVCRGHFIHQLGGGQRRHGECSPHSDHR